MERREAEISPKELISGLDEGIAYVLPECVAQIDSQHNLGIPIAKPSYDLAIRAAVRTDQIRAERGLGTSREWPSQATMNARATI